MMKYLCYNSLIEDADVMRFILSKTSRSELNKLVEIKDFSNRTLFHYLLYVKAYESLAYFSIAISSLSDEKLAKTLLSVDLFGYTPLLFAVDRQYPLDVIQLIIALMPEKYRSKAICESVELDETAISVAIKNKSYDIVDEFCRYLSAHQIFELIMDGDASNVMYNTFKSMDNRRLKMVLSKVDKKRITLLHKIAIVGRVDLMVLFLKLYPELIISKSFICVLSETMVEKYFLSSFGVLDATLFSYAVSSGGTDIVRMLLSKMSIRMLVDAFNSYDKLSKCKRTVLQQAIYSGDIKMVQVLLKYFSKTLLVVQKKILMRSEYMGSRSVLESVVQSGNKKMLDVLLDYIAMLPEGVIRQLFVRLAYNTRGQDLPISLLLATRDDLITSRLLFFIISYTHHVKLLPSADPMKANIHIELLPEKLGSRKLASDEKGCSFRLHDTLNNYHQLLSYFLLVKLYKKKVCFMGRRDRVSLTMPCGRSLSKGLKREIVFLEKVLKLVSADQKEELWNRYENFVIKQIDHAASYAIKDGIEMTLFRWVSEPSSVPLPKLAPHFL